MDIGLRTQLLKKGITDPEGFVLKPLAEQRAILTRIKTPTAVPTPLKVLPPPEVGKTLFRRVGELKTQLTPIAPTAWKAPAGYEYITGPSKLPSYTGVISEPGTIKKWGIPTTPVEPELKTIMVKEELAPPAVKEEVGFDLKKLQTDYTSAQAEKKKVYDDLVDFQTKSWDTEYTKAGMDAKKTKIANLDSQIATKKTEATAAEGKINENPWLSEASRVGRVRRLWNMAQAEINNLINERNTATTDYNSSIDEITNTIKRQTTDKSTKYDYWDKESTRIANVMKDYQTELATQLKAGTEKKQWEKEYALKVAAAAKPKTSIEKVGGRIVLIDVTTGATIKDLGPAPVGATKKRTANLQAIKDPFTGEVTGYFDPITGQSTVYGAKEGVPAAPTDVFGTYRTPGASASREQILSKIQGWYSEGKNYRTIKGMINNLTKDRTIPTFEKSRWHELNKQLK